MGVIAKVPAPVDLILYSRPQKHAQRYHKITLIDKFVDRTIECVVGLLYTQDGVDASILATALPNSCERNDILRSVSGTSECITHNSELRTESISSRNNHRIDHEVFDFCLDNVDGYILINESDTGR
jgi:hypothetical protein